MIRREEVIAYVLEHPDSTSPDVAAALGTDTHVVGAHLARAAKEGAIEQVPVTGRAGKFAYGPPGWTLPRPKRTPKAAPSPKGAWRCFHCGFVATTTALADAHFGSGHPCDDRGPLCLRWEELDEQGRATELQAAHERIALLDAERDAAEERADRAGRERDRLARVLAVERGDETQARAGWVRTAGAWWRAGSHVRVLERLPGLDDERPTTLQRLPVTESRAMTVWWSPGIDGEWPTALEAMEAVDAEVSDG